MEPSNTFNSLPTEMVLKIYSYLSKNDLKVMSNVNLRLGQIASEVLIDNLTKEKKEMHNDGLSTLQLNVEIISASINKNENILKNKDLTLEDMLQLQTEINYTSLISEEHPY